jgi:hypothetical protein
MAWVAPLDKQDVPPQAEMAAEALAGADGPEPGSRVQGQAGDVLGEDAGLEGPDAGAGPSSARSACARRLRPGRSWRW